MKKVPIWIWVGAILFCILEWTFGYWVPRITDNTKEAFLITMFFSFILYPIFAIIAICEVFDKIQENKVRTFAFIVIMVPFITNKFIYDFVAFFT